VGHVHSHLAISRRWPSLQGMRSGRQWQLQEIPTGPCNKSSNQVRQEGYPALITLKYLNEHIKRIGLLVVL